MSIQDLNMKQKQDHDPDSKNRMCFDKKLVHPASDKHNRSGCDSAQNNEELRDALA
jgi:hypothetical protein